jgi:nucleoside-diphosphate kinase
MKYIEEKSLVIIKPDGVQRSLIGEVINRLERVGLKLIALKFQIPTPDQARSHYTIDSEWIEKVGKKSIAGLERSGHDISTLNPIEIGNKILSRLEKYLSSGPVVVMVWQGAHAVDVIRKLVGGTEPRTSDVGTIRGDFVHDSYEIADIENRSVRNVIHASSSIEEALKEIAVWFEQEELISYRLISEAILYDVNIDGETE